MKCSLLFACFVILVLSLKPSNALKKMEVNLGQSQMLKCDMSYHHEINWIRMDDQAKPKTLMVMGLKNDGAMSVAWNFNDSHFEGCVVDRFIGLRIYQVSESDLATYFCAASHNKRMEFGEGIRLQTQEKLTQHGQDEGLFSSSGEKFHSHVIIAVALSCGMLLMVVTLIGVHIKTQKRQI
ncbi:hypothetical protein AMEX_G27141 [Astyanax mexicanus]|uniref:Ig-like domain-containing protein n=1 Tax=Astyanax mexicanus TaxID=7994 RepID=A0A8T2KJT6_ASTMX|nr:hypothetical protein AMEX_G27141 [Astyanax mexicanus]